ncbi:MAG: hypothetical protein ACUVWR_16105, partial [Anaerolineae bacterium]
MADQSPAERFPSEVDSLKNSVSGLYSRARLATLRDELEDLDTTITGLAQSIKDLRVRGYMFEKDLEERTADLERRWAPIRPNVLSRINQAAMDLERELNAVENRVTELAARGALAINAQQMLQRAKAEVDALESRVTAAESDIRGMYDSFKSEVDKLTYYLRDIDWALRQIAEASFPLLATEGIIRAVKATWIKGAKEVSEDPKGILFLTDQRLLFEQKQEIATKKVLFITTAKEKVQKLQLEVPLTQVAGVQASDRGLLGHEDHIEVDFEAGAPVHAAHFHVDGQDSHLWQGLIGRAKTRDFDQGRAVQVKAEEAEKVQALPTECPACGAPITQLVPRGANSINCQYCNKLI